MSTTPQIRPGTAPRTRPGTASTAPRVRPGATADVDRSDAAYRGWLKEAVRKVKADANRSAERQRRAFAMVCKGISCRRDEEAYQRYLKSLKAQHEGMGLKT